MSSKLKQLVLGGVTFLVALTIIVVLWHRDADLKVRSATAVKDAPSPPDPKSARYVGAYTVPLTPDGKAAAAATARMSEVLSSRASSSAKAQALVTVFPQLPADAQSDAVRHIVNLLPDNAYPSFATQLTNANISAAVRSVIYADLLQRPNALKLPWLLAMARSPGVGQATGAAALLQATLREDHGTNWDAWLERIGIWLQTHPEESMANVRN
jgi:hypothetical protein